MHVPPDTATLIVSTVAVALVALLSVPSQFALTKRIFSRDDTAYRENEKLYEDDDGKATEESQKSTAFWSRSFGLYFAIFGLAVSVVYAILVTAQWQHARGILVYSWTTVGACAFITLQAAVTFITKKPVARFKFGILAALSCLITAFVVFFEHSGILHARSGFIFQTLAWIEGAFLLISFLSFLSIRRRPEVFKNGRTVDGQFTASALSRVTFTWGATMLAYSRKNKSLELDDLPLLSGYQRSQVVEQMFNTMEPKLPVQQNSHAGKDSPEKQKNGAKLIWMLFRMFKWPFFKQTAFITVTSVLQLAPQYAMLQLLEILETRGPDTSMNEAWGWTFALAAAMILSAVLESWLFFVVWSDLGGPMRSLLSMLVFTKATKRADVKGSQKKKDQTPESPNDSATEPGKEEESAEEEAAAKSQQSTINLVGVDAKRVSDFCSFLYLYPGVVIKLTISMVFLGKLIGWKALLAGLAAFCVALPFNILLSKWYTAAQRRLMALRDIKVAVVNEALQGIRQIKFSAIEAQWEEKIAEKRREELEIQWKAFQYDTGLVSLWIFGPVMLSAVTLMAYALIHGELLPSVAFTTIAVLAQIEFVLAILPELTADAIDAWVACNRIEKYLKGTERIQTSLPGNTVKFEDATVAWPADDEVEDPDRFKLKGLSIEFPRRELSVISGKTGSGKSLLLAAIIGEIDKLAGKIYVPVSLPMAERFDDRATPVNWILPTSLAFVAQVPWIENTTIKNNILFGLPYDQGRYRKVLHVCALEKDLEILPDGDETEIGAQGIGLSGGQRWRVSFARAMYSRAGILVLDDIFSAVDSHVGRHLFEKALMGELGKGRTRILVTHHVGLVLPRTKYSVHLGEGTVQYYGLVEDLKKEGKLEEILKAEEVEEEEAEVNLHTNGHANGHLAAHADGGELTKVKSNRSVRSEIIDDGGVDTKGKDKPKRFTEDEKRETGSIKLDIYWAYIQSSGGLKIWAILMLFYLGNSGFSMARSYWVTLWTRSYQNHTDAINSTSQTPFHTFGSSQHLMFQVPPSPSSSSTEYATVESSSDHPLWYWLGIYLAFSVIVWFFGTFKYFMSYVASIKASYRLFDEMNYTILRTPLRWLDTVPVGRILNRYSSDFNTVDSRLAGNMGYFFYQGLELVAITVAGAVASPTMVALAVVLFLISMHIMRLYLNGAREVKRLESNARSPIFTDFGALLTGVATVRAFDKTATYLERMYKKIDAHGSAFYHIWLFNRWMGFRLSITGAAFAVAVAIVVVATRSIDAALAGFALTFALRYSSAIIWTMRGYSNVEMDLNSAERIIEYTRLPIEDQGGNPAPAAWPTSGRLEVNGLVAGYADDLPPVLKGLTFTVEDGQRVGVVGRTGAGKSSLTLALFRFIHQREGTVFIDGLDVSKIRLQDLRSRLAIIPQDPVLFSGTVRSNLDPFNEHSDADLRVALERVHLIQAGSESRASAADAPAAVTTTTQPAQVGAVPVLAGGDPVDTSTETAVAAVEQPIATDNKNIFSSLGSKISEGGLNLSQGQRQLLCLARAIVSRPRLMLLDEATSAVDMSTDELIQRSIREEFEGSTLLVIAHRLSTIADFDRILVMSDGQAVEFGSPKELMGKQDGVFRGMVEGSGEREKLEALIVGDKSDEPAEAKEPAVGKGGDAPGGTGSGVAALFG